MGVATRMAVENTSTDKKQTARKGGSGKMVSVHQHHLTDFHGMEAEITTLMLCDIPCRQSIEQIIDAINMLGFEGRYDLVYRPAKRPTLRQNMGYSFVNFNTVQ